MSTKQLSLSASIAMLTFATTTQAVLGPIPIYLNPTTLSANYLDDTEDNAAFASEVYLSSEIQNASATNLYEFLTQHSSIAFAPSSGNRFTQKLDLRGYGLTDGYQNVVITLNGRRLNNIDTAIQDLNIINLDQVERIEITKGSGSVAHGDSAMAGAIHIHTKAVADNMLKMSQGNYGLSNTTLSAGHTQDNLSFSISANKQQQGGFSVADPQGNKDKGYQLNKKATLTLKPNTDTEVLLDYHHSDLDTRYPNYLTWAQFSQDPSQNSTARVYTHQQTNYDIYNLKIKHQIDEQLSLSTNIAQEDKSSTNAYYDWQNISNYDTPVTNLYDYLSADVRLKYQQDRVKVDAGISYFDGQRKASSNTSTKDNRGIFVQGNYQASEDLRYTLGARKEWVDYAYKPNSGTARFGDHQLEALELGVNRKINDKLSIFSNYNLAFQAPLIDRFFKWDGSFNGFMNPSKSKTLNLGLSHTNSNSKSKLTLFRSNIRDEMYYYASGYKNTNIDKSHKWGLESQYKRQITDKLDINLNYAYTIAKIDEEDEASGAYNGNYLPMTSKHNISLSANYRLDDKSNLTLVQKYRSSTFSEEDFANSATQKQKAFNTTDFTYRYQYNNNLELSLDAENLFNQSYGTWLRDDVIYPANFTRNIKAGLTYRF